MFKEFRHKMQQLTYLEFQGHDRHDWLTLDLSDDELLSELSKLPGLDLFLGRYTMEEIEERLRQRGILDKLATAGYPDVKVEVNTDLVYNHRLYVHTGVRDYDHILIELRLREGMFEPKTQFIPEVRVGALSMIMVDYLLLQNPKAGFHPGRPALPQQNYPGLGILKDMIPMVIEVVRESGRAGVLDVPEHYHGALFYSKWFKFINPAMDGKFRAMRRDLGSHPLNVVSVCVFNECLKNLATGECEKWAPGEQVLPISDLMLDYYGHPRYNEMSERAFTENRYDLDLERYERKVAEGLTLEKIPVTRQR
jgi:hypothetical protein